MFDVLAVGFKCRANVVQVVVRVLSEFCRVLDELKVIMKRLVWWRVGIRCNMTWLSWCLAWRWWCRRCAIDGRLDCVVLSGATHIFWVSLHAI